jgi:hypothetical protein
VRPHHDESSQRTKTALSGGREAAAVADYVEVVASAGSMNWLTPLHRRWVHD